jgi:hypothetical protein
MHAASFQPAWTQASRKDAETFTIRDSSAAVRYPKRAKSITVLSTAIGASWDRSMNFFAMLSVILPAASGEGRR